MEGQLFFRCISYFYHFRTNTFFIFILLDSAAEKNRNIGLAVAFSFLGVVGGAAAMWCYMKRKSHKPKPQSMSLQINYPLLILHIAKFRSLADLVPVGRLPRPSRSMYFGDVSETNGWETP